MLYIISSGIFVRLVDLFLTNHIKKFLSVRGGRQRQVLLGMRNIAIKIGFEATIEK